MVLIDTSICPCVVNLPVEAIEVIAIITIMYDLYHLFQIVKVRSGCYIPSSKLKHKLATVVGKRTFLRDFHLVWRQLSQV